mmetsp:Transcript_56500/g.148957  ORF Transcript_56500/g.148957 Transcript_56500/m.148957 type:complete len:111 (-) Transcript_56500:225-557(-)
MERRHFDRSPASIQLVKQAKPGKYNSQHQSKYLAQKRGQNIPKYLCMPLYAPVADPGFTNNFPSCETMENLCVCPVTRTSTSSWRCSIDIASMSPHGTIWWPWQTPIFQL